MEDGEVRFAGRAGVPAPQVGFFIASVTYWSASYAMSYLTPDARKRGP